MEAKTIKSSSQILKVFLPFLLIIMIFNTQQTVASPTCTKSSTNLIYTNFIHQSCNATSYPSLCYDSLYSYSPKIKTNPLQLSKTAVSVTLKSAKECYSLVKTLAICKKLSSPEKAVVKDCKEEIGDSIDHLKISMDELKSLKGSDDAAFHMANIKTWVSAAITDAGTCSDELEEMNVSQSFKSKVKMCVADLDQLMSNSLALINGMKY